MSKPELKVGELVRVRMGPEIEGKIQRVGLVSATLEVETDLGTLVISAPLGAISRLNGEAPPG